MENKIKELNKVCFNQPKLFAFGINKHDQVEYTADILFSQSGNTDFHINQNQFICAFRSGIVF